MAVPWGVSPDFDGPAGYTYAALLVRTPGRPGDVEELRGLLRRIRFSGWVAPPQDGWVPVLPAGVGTVAAGRRGVMGVGELLAGTGAAAVVAVRVLGDRQLAVVAWGSGGEVARYVSDPSREPGADADVVAEPVGAEGAHPIAAACGRPELGDQLEELLTEPLDPDEEIESERLTEVLRLLGLPTWLVNAWRLPRGTPTGPPGRDLVRLGAGLTGVLGWMTGRAAARVRRWRPPPPVLADPPRDSGGTDDLAWL